MVWGMPRDFYNSQNHLKENGGFWCPAGHQRHFVSGESEEIKLRRQLQQKIQNEAYLNDQIKAAERRTSAARGVVTRIKNRVSHGVCPCCNRTFANLMRHMKTKHPAYNEKEAA
jgi:hypothetical protein